MNDIVIDIQNIGKKYRIDHQHGGYVALRDQINEAIFHPLKSAKHKFDIITGKITKEDYWALKGINFQVERGEVLGIIGPNGAGKSTLLKILTRITPPTTGTVRLLGRVSSLLEVGTGFHPELTGRENVYLNGAILGMPQTEIAKKFDQIVDFSGVEKFIDTPVKFFSSGMYVRLAFSVAAHMEPDILLVDEVLAVGDAAFQKKCLGKIDEVTKSGNRTVLFVSHNMTAVQSLCNRAVLIDSGKLAKIGPTAEIINYYLKQTTSSNLENRKDRKQNGSVRVTSFFVEQNGKKITSLVSGQKYTFCLAYENLDKKPITNAELSIAITLEDGTPLIFLWSKYSKQNFRQLPHRGTVKCQIIQKFPLSEGLYEVSARIACDQGTDHIKHAGLIDVQKMRFYNNGNNYRHSPVLIDQIWSLK